MKITCRLIVSSLILLSTFFQGSSQVDSLIPVLEDELPEAVVKESRTYSNEIIRLDKKHFLNLAASFDDPSRLLQSYPSISTSNDQSNSIIYRGIPSMFNTWSINGAEIINPNHLSNAGTRLDLGSMSAGGVNMYSGQILKSTLFQLSPNYSLHSGLGANINMEMKVDEKEYLLSQVSLIGLEAGFNKSLLGSKWYLMTNARYSTTGLLADIGVTFDGEEIRFSDYVLGIGTRTYNFEFNANLSYGHSSNQKNPLEKSLENFKDYSSIAYSADQIILSMSSKYITSREAKIKTSLAISTRVDRKDAYTLLNPNTNNSLSEHGNQGANKISFNVSLENSSGIGVSLYTIYSEEDSYLERFRETRLVSAINLKEGIKRLDMSKEYKNLWLGAFYSRKMSATNIFADGQCSISSEGDYLFNSSFNIEHALSNKDIVLLSRFSRRNQNLGQFYLDTIQSSYFPTASPNSIAVNQNYELGIKINKAQKLQLTLFYHYITGLPFDQESPIFISEPILFQQASLWRNDGRRKSYGVEVSTENQFSKGYYIHINGSFFNTEIQRGENAEWHPSFYDVGYNFNAIVSRSIQFDKYKSIRISSSLKRTGGFKHPKIDTQQSSFFYTINNGQEDQEHLKAYTRLDLRVVYATEKSLWSLDIQNIIGIQNEAYQYFDSFLAEVQTQMHLGTIPILSYRRNF